MALHIIESDGPSHDYVCIKRKVSGIKLFGTAKYKYFAMKKPIWNDRAAEEIEISKPDFDSKNSPREIFYKYKNNGIHSALLALNLD
jgi:hypothetical protein